MKKIAKIISSPKFRDQRGVTLILVAILMFVFLGIAALAIDLSHLYVVRNELQNAADAGALAGARFLYNEYGTSVNIEANQIAYNTATKNEALTLSGAEPVDVNWSQGQNSGDNVDVQRGHWSFATGVFNANDSLVAVELWGVSSEDLDTYNPANPFINAVRVVARRQTFPAASFFARIFGYQDFEVWKEAVAYIGFAGTLAMGEVDQPIAICKQAIVDEDGNYNCNTGRMIDSGGGTTHNTAAWSNFTQEPCQTASAQSVSPLVCGSGNPAALTLGEGMGTVGGMQDNVYRDLLDCWLDDPFLFKDWRGYPTEPWSLTLPVIDCPGNNPGPCSELVGAVTLNVLWIKQSGSDPQWKDIPVKMETWKCTHWENAGEPENINALNDTQRQECWQEFAQEYNLKTADGTSVGNLTHSQLQKTIFFLPSCEPHELKGNTGGENFGVLARIPVLVQ
jgi:Flp pilus assembly protein TadG